MKYIMTIFILIGLCGPAIAGEVIAKVGDDCPSGYRNGKGQYCYRSTSSGNEGAIEKTDGQCPRGYRNGKGQYCYNRGNSDSVIIKEGGKCPRGYRDGPGRYCYQ